jgi:RHS repeat-associated protein
MPTKADSAPSDSNAPQPESSPFSAPHIELPKGGGAIRGIGEKFQANAATGTGKLTIPMAVSPGRSGFGPDLSLSYDSGSGNGICGIGWNFASRSVTRKTDKGFPKYRRRELQECDVFILSGAEDLVPLLIQDSEGHWVDDKFEIEGHRVKRYRPRMEGLFARIERWTRLEDGDEHWRSISKDNTLTVYGRDEASRIYDPANPHHVFSWLICESYDDKGNAVVYEYVAENGEGVDPEHASEKNRTRTANRYPKRILYGNRRPLLSHDRNPGFRASHLERCGFENADWMFEVVFDYGDGHYHLEGKDDHGQEWVCCSPEPLCEEQWPVRKDPFSRYRARFEVRTYRLCQRVLMFHHFPEEQGSPATLVRSTEFEYRQKAIGSFITKVVQSGYVRHNDDRYLKKSMPALELDYTSSPLESERYRSYQAKEVDPVSLQNLPAGIDGENYRWVDLNGEGISGVLTEQGTGWYYQPNAGHGRFGATELVANKPSLAQLNRGQQQLLDIAGDGTLNLVQFDSSAPGFYERTWEEDWGGFRTFRSLPVLNWKDPNLKFVDVTGDGIADILITADDAFLWHESLLDEGFGAAIRVPVPADECKGPHVIFADGIQSIYLADMSGDGHSDIVRIRNAEVCYWPNLGYGTFGAKVVMDNAPWFEDDDLFLQSRVKLADTDGSGCTDIIYLASDGIRIYLNESGNAWSNARFIPHFAPVTPQTSVSVVDFLGRGTACVLWSSTLPGDFRQSLRYIDLMDGQKPHLLTTVRNNLGAETRIEYSSSTEFYLADKAAGKPWLTRLPFPVHVVKRVETYDYISRNRFVSSYSYHHGFFDGVEREFRGFGMVEQLDTEQFATLGQSNVFPVGDNIDSASSVPPVLTKTWFHTGVYLRNGWVSRHLAHEYYREPVPSGVTDRDEYQAAMLLDDTILPEHLTPEEAREACRALKGSMLRQEIYALDGKEESERPYSVAESNFTIVPLQPREHNLHAVFFTHPREALTFHYERKLYEVEGARLADPRVSHSMTFEVDEYGDVIESASIGYGRRIADASPLLTDADRCKQRQILLTFSDNRFTNAVLELHAYRTPLPAESRTHQLFHVVPESNQLWITNLFRFEELKAKIACASDGKHDLPFEDVDAKGATEDVPYRRLIEENRTYYRADHLDRILPLGVAETLALPGRNYKLAFTPGLITQVYRREEPQEELIHDVRHVLHHEGKYVELTGDGRWWIPSGRIFYAPHECDALVELEQARRHFFLTRRFLDPFNNPTRVTYDCHDLMPVEVRDAVGNVAQSEIDYRVLAPYRMTDANRNRSAVAFDALGLVVGTAVMGKLGQHAGDSLDGFDPDLDEATVIEHLAHPLRNPQAILKLATTRMVYDLFAYVRTGDRAHPEPTAVYNLVRETHTADLQRGQHTKIQHAFSYSDGFRREIQKKIQAEPGPLTEGGPAISPRWVGSGWTIFNNKGKPVRQYERFFSAHHTFEFASIVGVSSILFYDPLERVVATFNPNHTYEKVVFDPWRQENWDVNDTVLQSHPARDPDVGDFFARLPHADYLPTWYDQRSEGQLGRAEQQAALKTRIHGNTPTVSYLDALGRTFLMVAHNRFEREGVPVDQYLATRIEQDIENNQRAVIDAFGRIVMRYDYDMLSTRLRQISVDAGTRWMLNDILGKIVLSWDSRSHRCRHEYDALHRPTNFYVRARLQSEILAERIVYGEGQPNDFALNLRNKPFRQFDAAGVITNEHYDFKGNLLKSKRQLLEDYQSEVDWAQSPELEPHVFTTATTYNALNRAVTLTTPDSSVARPKYNDANLLESLAVNVRGAEEATPFVTFINYNANGQREIIDYGNGAHTRCTYDPLTFRMIHLLTRRKQDQERLQDLRYTFDPVGNIISIHDEAQETVYFRNRVVSPSNEYVYDAMYRLISAEGREHAGKPGEPQTTHDDVPRMNYPLPSDGQALHRYRELYDYDGVGNILQLLHQSPHGNWAREYRYDDSDQPRNNHLSGTQVGQWKEFYSYDHDGNMTRMPHLPKMEWDFKDQLHTTRTQVTNSERGETTYYVYNSAGQRVRKVTERGSGSRKQERIYLGSFEIYRKYDSVGAPTLERETLHVMDDKRQIALVETKTLDDSRCIDEPTPRIRFQFDNHLGSAVLELDDHASVITYEEYYPYGSTSFEAAETASDVSKKRYRYTGKERDEETGFYYHGARHYAPWLGRWTACDPARSDPSLTPYDYAANNPIKWIDPKGKSPEDSDKKGGAGSHLLNTLAAGTHAIAEGAIWNPTVWGSISRNARIARDTSRGVWVERLLGNTNSAILNRLTGSLGRYTAAADRATSTVVQQIKSTSNLNKVAQITRDATRDASRFIASDATYAGRAAQARIVLPTGTPGTVVEAAEDALNGLKKAIPGTSAAPKVTTGLPGVGGIALKALAPLGAALSAYSLGEDIAKGDVAASVSDASGAVAGGLETFAIASTALGASGTAVATGASATTVGVGLGGTATGAAAFAAEAAPVVAAFGVGVAAGTYINNNTGISDTAQKAGDWVEKHTGGSVIAGASAAALTSIATSPYYAAVAADHALEAGGSWLGNKAYDLLH